MERLFKVEVCDRCGGSLEDGRIMSMYNTQIICMKCKAKERQRADYDEAVKADQEAIKAGNYNFPGIGLKPESETAIKDNTMDKDYLINLIKRAGEVAPATLTAAEREFLNKAWSDRTDEEKAPFYEAWREMPGTIEQAAANIPADIIKSVSRTVNLIITTMQDNGVTNMELESISIMELSAALEYEASRHQDGAQAE